MGALIGLLFLVVLALVVFPVVVLGMFIIYRKTGGKLSFRDWFNAMEF